MEEKLEENNQEQGLIGRKLKKEAVKLFGVLKLTSSITHYGKKFKDEAVKLSRFYGLMPSLKLLMKICRLDMNTEKQISRAETSSEERNHDQEIEENLIKIKERVLKTGDDDEKKYSYENPIARFRTNAELDNVYSCKEAKVKLIIQKVQRLQL